MVCGHVLELVTSHGSYGLVGLDAARRHGLERECLCGDIEVAVCRLDNHVVIVGVEGNCLVAGECPGSGSPDDEVCLVKLAYSRELTLIVGYLELDVDRGAVYILVFDLSLGKCGLTLSAPIYGLESLVDIPVLVHLAKHLDLSCLEGGSHGEIGMLPVAEHAQALELCHLNVHEVLSELMATATELGHRQLLSVHLGLLDNSRLDGHTVVVPAGHIGGIVAAHCLGLDDKVLEYLVHRCSHVDISVGKGRSVMENERGLALVSREELLVYFVFFRCLLHFGLSLGQIRSHRKLGLGKVKRRGIINCHFCISLQ